MKSCFVTNSGWPSMG